MRLFPFRHAVLLSLVLTSFAHAQFAPPPPDSPVPLRCNGQAAPWAVDGRNPRFSWLGFGRRSATGEGPQSRVLVASDAHTLGRHAGLVWASSWAVRPALALRYDGPALREDTTYFWTVETRIAGHQRSVTRPPARFHTAAGSWSAQWIQAPWSTEGDGAALDGSRPMPILRRSFPLRNRPAEAYLRIAGLGQYEAVLNGAAPLNAGGLNQAWTDYRKTITYDTFNVTERLHAGENVLSVLLGNGMYNVQHTPGRYTKFEGSFGPPKLIAELRVRYADGSTECLGTDTQWQAARGPVLFSSTYGGEDFDARRWPANWDRPGPVASPWQPAVSSASPGGVLRPALAPLVTVHGTYPAVSRHVLSPTRTVFDIGQNMAGWPTITVHGPPGAVLQLRGGELLNADGTVSQGSTGHPQWWTYTLHGAGEEHWTPRFSTWGYRYLQADWVEPPGAAAKAAAPQPAEALHAGVVDSVVSHALSSASAVTGSFRSSSDLLNRIHALVVWATHNNEGSLFTDCPHREKLGWLEETHLVAPGMLFNNDLAGLYAATQQNIADAQQDNGAVPTIAPQYTRFGPRYAVYDDSPEWGSAAILAPWVAYRSSGDSEPLRANYAVMQRYLSYLAARAQDGIVAYGLGDWYDVGPGSPGMEKNTTLGVTGTLMLYQDAAVMEQIATLLGHAEDAAHDHALASQERDAFQRHFWHPALGFYDTGSQTANAMPLALGIVPPEDRAAVLQHVLDDIHAHADHLTTGEVGFPYLVRLLLESGHSDVLLAMALRTDPPGYGSQLAAGATALTEAWDADPKNSQDHLMLGGIEEWFYRGLGGISVDRSGPDPASWIKLRPQFVRDLSWVDVSTVSSLGKVHVRWQRTGAIVDLSVTIPDEAQATLELPAGAHVLHSINTRSKRAGSAITVPIHKALTAVRLGSGTFRFTVSLGDE